MTGAEILVKCLEAEGVDTVFGYPGGQMIPLHDVLYDAPIRHILTRHEQGAAHAAEGYARATGKVGVCLATSGPGATNLVTGIADAYMDSVPLVAITGQVPVPMLGKDSFQEVDITGITLPVTKHNYLVKDVRDISRIVHEAFHIARSGRPGPVLIDFPKDVAVACGEYTAPETVNLVVGSAKSGGCKAQIRAAAAAIEQAGKPVLYAGGGVVAGGASAALRELAEMRDIPVVSTLMGLGCFPGDHPLSLGMLGMHGTAYANYAVDEADLLIAVGVRFDDRVTGKVENFAARARIIHIDIDAAEIGKNVDVDIPLVGDLAVVLPELVAAVTPGENREWLERVAWLKTRFPLRYERGDKLKPQYVIEKFYEATQGKALVVTEVGQHQMWAAQHYLYDAPRSFLSSGGLGTMGFGLPAAIGAQIGCPDRLVINISGDGSFQMNLQEMATAARYQLPIKVAILNNKYLGMVRQWQELFFRERYAFTDIADQPDFLKLAEAYGWVGLRVEREEDVAPAIEKALAVTDKPVLMDFRIDPQENVYPMIPAGGTVNDMLLGAREPGAGGGYRVPGRVAK
ncbi:MAG: biosynthetic-type acetolactate synthase large subunit [bacterium]